MLLRILDGDFEAFNSLWERGDNRSNVLKKAVRMSYYLASRVYGLSDNLIAKTMNEIPSIGAESDRRIFQPEWLKISIKRDLGGRDKLKKFRRTSYPDQQSRDEASESRMTIYRHAPITASEAYRLCTAIQKLVSAGEEPIPQFIKDVAATEHTKEYRSKISQLTKGRKGNSKDGDIHFRRLVLNRRRSSLHNEVEEILHGILHDMDLNFGSDEKPKNVNPPEESTIALSLFLRRVIEREVELFLLNHLELGDDFDWMAHISKRQKNMDEERYKQYPDFVKAVQGIVSGVAGEGLEDLMRKIDV